MRTLPPFPLIAAFIVGLSLTAMSSIGSPGDWLAWVAPRAAAEDAIIQARFLHRTPMVDDGCPWPGLKAWVRLRHARDAGASFDFTFRTARTDAGRLMSLAGLAATDTVSYQSRLDTWVQSPAFPDSFPVTVGERAEWEPAQTILSDLTAGRLGTYFASVDWEPACNW